MIQAIAFYLFAATALVFALLVVAARSPVYSALSLIGCLFAVAGVFALNSAHLVAILQVLVYAGAIMVLILFVIMLLNLSPAELGKPVVNTRKVLAVLLSGITGALLIGRMGTKVWGVLPAADDRFGSIEGVGKVLFTQYLLPFEMVSLLLLAAIIGAALLSRRERGDRS